MDGPTNSPEKALREAIDPAIRERVRKRLFDAIGPGYSPWFHLIFPSTFGLGLMVAALALLRDVHAWQLALVPVYFLLLNAGEWAIHRDLLHRRKKPMQLLYDRHTPEHHVVFVQADMAVRSRREWKLVLIPPWGIVAAFFSAIPVPAALIYFGQWNLAMLFVATIMFYVVSYEWLHLSYHLPPDSFIGRMKLIAFLRRHHATHHDPRLMQKWNFNVTVPLWDLVRGTIYRAEAAKEEKGTAPA